MRKQADALKVCPIPDACLLVMAQRPSRLLGLPETRSLIFLIKNSPDQVEGYLDYLQPCINILGSPRSPRLASRVCTTRAPSSDQFAVLSQYTIAVHAADAPRPTSAGKLLHLQETAVTKPHRIKTCDKKEETQKNVHTMQ